jgi:hypothetical protein
MVGTDMVPSPDDADTRDAEGSPLSARKVRLNIEDDLRLEEHLQEKNLLRSRATKH